MAKFRIFPLFNELVLKYFAEDTGWIPEREWEAEDLVKLELFANSELQRRAAARAGDTYVDGPRTIH